MKTYKSKIGLSIAIPLFTILALTTALMIWDKSTFGIIILLISILFTINMYLNTYYKIEGKTLIVKGGFFMKTTIEIEKIKKIVKTNSILSAPALSFDRIEIFYNKYDTIILSPEHKSQFIAHLKNINPSIESDI